jgi:hypothetical protein
LRPEYLKRATIAFRSTLRTGTMLAAFCSAVALGGCGSMMAKMPLIGEPDIAQNRPAERPDYMAVFGKGTEPDKKAMTAAERDKLQAELAAQRENAANAKRQEINQPR